MSISDTQGADRNPPFLMFHVKHFWYKSLNFHFYTFCVIIKVRIKKGG
nr:MAG TPA: hypothetical protein [Bacteriophage sp.]